jgi:hypothetical protein
MQKYTNYNTGLNFDPELALPSFENRPLQMNEKLK